MLKKNLLGTVFYIVLNSNLFAFDSPIIGENLSGFAAINVRLSCTPDIGNTEIIIYNNPVHNKERIDSIHCQPNDWFLTVLDWGKGSKTICTTRRMPYFTDGKTRYFRVTGENQCELITTG